MSYCVNCGVELDASAEKCVLCGTAVLNPNNIDKAQDETPFATESHIPKSISRRFVAYIVSVVIFAQAFFYGLFLFFPSLQRKASPILCGHLIPLRWRPSFTLFLP